jgi:hypothetical protein
MSTALINHHMLWGMELHKKPSPSDEFWNALKADNTATVKRLYQKFNLNVDQDGYTPLMWATYNGNVELVKLFLKGGAYVNTRNRNNGFTVLMYVTGPGGIRDCNPQIAEILLEAGADPNVHAANSLTAMEVVVGDKRLVLLLIKYGANSFYKDDAIHRALGGSRLETLALLADNTDYSIRTLSFVRQSGKQADKKVLALAAQKNVARKVLQEAQRQGIGAVDVTGIIKKQFGQK